MPTKRSYNEDSEPDAASEKRRHFELNVTAALKVLPTDYPKIIRRLMLYFGSANTEKLETAPMYAPAKRPLKIVQANINKNENKLSSLLKKAVDIIAVQEPLPERIIDYPGWQTFASSDPKQKCVTFVTSGLDCRMLECSPTHVSIKVNNVVITNVYNPEETTAFEKIVVHDGQYVVGDFNIHSRRWGVKDDRTLERRKFEEWIDVNGLQVLTPKGTVTSFSGGGATIDLLLGPATGGALKDSGGKNDHKWLEWEINLPVQPYEVVYDPELFDDALEELPDINSKSLKEVCSSLTKMLQRAMDKSRIKTLKMPIPEAIETMVKSVPSEAVSTAEIEQLVRNLQGEPGPDGITASVINLAWQNKRWQNAYIRLVRYCVQSGHHPWKRIVTVEGERSDLLGQVVESLVQRRLAQCLGTRLSGWQFAGRTGYNATDAALCVDNALRRKLKVMALRADFGEINPEALECSMKAMGVPHALVKWTRSFMGNGTKGIPRNSPVSEALFSIYVDPLLRKVKGLAYAEQIVLLNEETALCKDYEECLGWGEANKVVFRSTQLIEKVSLNSFVEKDLNGVPFQREVVLFGVHFDCALKYTNHVRVKGEEFLRAVHACHQAAGSIGEALSLYKTHCRPIIETASIVWYAYLTERNKDALARMDDMALRKLMHIGMPTGTVFNHRETGVSTIGFALEQYDAAYRRRVQYNMAPQNPVHKIFEVGAPDEITRLGPEKLTAGSDLEKSYYSKTEPLGPFLDLPTRGVKNLLRLRALYAQGGKSFGDYESENCNPCLCGAALTIKHVLLKCDLSRLQREAVKLPKAWPHVLNRRPERIIEFLNTIEVDLYNSRGEELIVP